MKNIEQLHGELMDTTETLGQLLETAAHLPESGRSSLVHWQDICTRSGQSLRDRRVRVAAIGAIKSGKSTLVNALLGDDHLRRGAGVVTSIVTRVRKGDVLKAHLFFKSWEAINNEIRQALVLFPDGNGGALDTLGFDLRNGEHREALAQGLTSLSGDQLIRSDMRDPNSVLLDAYLKGYPEVAPLIDEEERRQAYEGEAFGNHQRFAGDDALAVYLRDIELEIPTKAWDDRVEIADCQGSDSPNPHHLAMIQDYLVSAHLMVYVISSRTGLRQADVKFITMLQQMGGMANILFVINCDLSEHEHLADLERVVTRTRDELMALTPAPQVYAFSALYRLFSMGADDLSAKEKGRLEAWQADAQMTAFVDAQRKAFETLLQYKLQVEGFSVQAAAHIDRLATVRSAFGQWLDLAGRLLHEDEAAARELRDRIEQHQNRMARSQPMLKSALKGAVSEIKNELRTAVDRFFDPHSGEGVKALMAVVTDPGMDLAAYGDALQKDKFSDVLYRLLQEYRRRVDRTMAEGLNPALVRFIREAEERLAEMLAEVGGPHAEMVRQALNDYHRAVAGEGDASAPPLPEVATRVDLDALRRELKLELPTSQATLDYSLQMRGEAIVHLGVDRFAGWIRRLLRRPGKEKAAGAGAAAGGAKGQRALTVALKRMRREMATSIRSHLMNHRENIKYQYLLKLADTAGEALYNQLTAHYGIHLTELADRVSRARSEDPRRSELEGHLARLTEQLQTLGDRLEAHRIDLDTLSRSYADRN